MMKKLLFVLTLMLCLINFNSCKFDRIDHVDDKYVYVWKYAMFGNDSVLIKYHRPIDHITIITNKKTHRRFIGVPGKGGHWRTNYYITYRINGEELIEDVSHEGIYYKVNIGTKVVVREEFYPRYSRKIVIIYK